MVALLAVPRPAAATMPPLSGAVPEQVSTAFANGLFGLPERTSGLGVSITQNQWRVPVILVSFSDSPLLFGPNDFNRSLFDTTGSTVNGSVSDYYRWVSGGRLSLTGEVVATVDLPNSRSYYGAASWGLNVINTPKNSYGVLRDALRICQSSVNWSDFDVDRDGYVDMVWVVHAGIGGEASSDRSDLWSITSRMAVGWRGGASFITTDPVPGTNSQHMLIDRFTILPELSAFTPSTISEIGVFCHEFGHALGLPDLYDTANTGGPLNMGPGNWSLMSSGAYGGDGSSPEFPSHLSAWPLQFLGWDQTIRPAHDTTLVLDPINRDGTIVEWSFQGDREPEHFLIENRRREGFESELMREGLLIYHVDEAVIGRHLATNTINSHSERGLWLVEADGDSDLVMGRNRGDPSDPFPGLMGRVRIDDDTRPSTRTFADAVTNLAMTDIALQGEQTRFSLRVRASGWLPATEFSGTDFHPLDQFGSARVSGIDEHQVAYLVSSELRAGRSQVVLRSSRNGWAEPFQVSESRGAAVDPALALLPGGNLVIVWSDTRSGRSELYFRSRLQGRWTAERLLFSQAGDCRNPAIGVDARGTVYLAFKHVLSGTPRIQLMRFTYYSPFGQAIVLSGPSERPASPAIAVDRKGIAYVIWADQAQFPQRLTVTSYSVEGGILGTRAVTAPPPHAQLGATAVVDSRGYLHLAWLASGPGINEIHYQRRFGIGSSAPDTVLESRGELMQNPELTLDKEDGVHLVFEAWKEGVSQIRYKRRQLHRGWDSRSTEVTDRESGIASRPHAFPVEGGNLRVAYIGYPDGRAHFMVRSRQLGEVPLTAVAVLPSAPTLELVLGPNPLPVGQPLTISWAGVAGGTPPLVDVYDVLGRRTAALHLERSGERWLGRVSAELTRRWSSGVYFARLRESSARAHRLVVIR